jgi:hypothetical protein
MATHIASQKQRLKPAAQNIAPRWLTFNTASQYAGVTEQTLRTWAKVGNLTLHNVTPAGSRGRVLIDRIELDKLIEGYANAPATTLAMNTNGQRFTGGRKGATRP